ncbi:hypothetical protein TorRG33x02_351710 [Trema orientale]|uniref:Uncharacterized protein n=1 Tax=Trema orientale TaxID=63057 RepID=A0A2P5AFE0_TREOI|nr:hypothetical protein TorRG33x02_351710 [Trema orientale]
MMLLANSIMMKTLTLMKMISTTLSI